MMDIKRVGDIEDSNSTDQLSEQQRFSERMQRASGSVADLFKALNGKD